MEYSLVRCSLILLILSAFLEAQQVSDCPIPDRTCASGSAGSLAVDVDQCPSHPNLIDEEICEHLPDIELPPGPNVTFKDPPSSYEYKAVVGGDVEFKCDTNPAPLLINWYRNGQLIKEDGILAFLDDKHKRLKLNPVGVKYFGEFRCVVFTEEGVVQASYWLSDRQGWHQACSLEFARKPEDRLVEVNEFVQLECSVRNNIPAAVTWHRTKNRVEEQINASTSGIHLVESGLIIPKARDEHSGIYTCRVSSSHNCHKESSAKITVYSRLSEVCGDIPQSRTLEGILNPKTVHKIKGGTSVPEGAIPWQVSLFHKWSQHFCGGVVLSNSWVLTAGHCLNTPLYKPYRMNQHTVTLRFGLHTLYKKGPNPLSSHNYTLYSRHEQVRRIRRVIFHPHFVHPRFEYDFALVKLDRPLKLNKYIRPICLPMEAIQESRGVVSGWGKGSDSSLNAAMIPIRSDATCEETARVNRHPYTESMFCAGEGNITSPKACTGDSGGPFQVLPTAANKWYLAGIVSFGPECINVGTRGYQHGFYAKVSAASQWMVKAMGYVTY